LLDLLQRHPGKKRRRRKEGRKKRKKERAQCLIRIIQNLTTAIIHTFETLRKRILTSFSESRHYIAVRRKKERKKERNSDEEVNLIMTLII